MKICITGSAGLIGFNSVQYFSKNKNNKIYGIDKNFRKIFYGDDGDVSKNIIELSKLFNYFHFDEDIRNREFIENLFKKEQFDAVIHTAAQPAHLWPDLEKDNDGIIIDFEINVTATLYLLEAFRKYCSKDSIFVFMSTNKCFGDAPNDISFKELETRFDFDDPKYINGIDETLRVQNTTHSLFGAGKLSADTYVKETGKYFNLNTACLRGGCLTGRAAGTEQHNFLNYLIKCNVVGRKYNVAGYKMKQVRDNIHSSDVVKIIENIIENPVKGEVFNIGGMRSNSISIMEAFDKAENITGKKMIYEYRDEIRKGDHRIYISNMNKFQSHYPNWRLQYSLDDIFEDIIEGFKNNNV